MRFRPGTVLRHQKTGRCYLVLMGPDVCRIEAGPTPAYAYRLLGHAAEGDATVWIRPASEMEDGRFVPEPGGGE